MVQTSGEGQVSSTDNRASDLNARTVLHAMKRRPLTLIGVVLLAVGAGAAVWFFLPVPKTTVAVAFRIAPQATFLLETTAESRIDLSSYRQSQITLLKRRQTLNGVLKQPAVQNLGTIQKQPDAFVWLDASLKIDARGSETMRVTLEGDNADELRTILESLSKVYLTEADDQDTGMRRQRVAKLEDTHRKYIAEIEQYRRRIDGIAKALGSKDGEALALADSLLRDDLRNAIQKLAVIKDQLQRAEIDLKGAQNLDDKGVPEPGAVRPEREAITPAQIDDELRRDPIFQQLEIAIGQAREELSVTQKLSRPGERTPAVIKAEKALSDAVKKRDQHREDHRLPIEERLRKQFEFREQDRLVTLRTTVASLRLQEPSAKKKVEDLQKEVSRSNAYRDDLAKVRLEVANTEKRSERVADEIERLKLELGGAPPRVTLSDEPAVVPGIEGNRRMKYSLIIVVVVLGAGFLGVVMWEQRSRRLTHPDDVATALGVRLIGSVPSANQLQGPSVGAHSVLVEAIDATRTMLLNGAHDCDLRVLLVASAVSGEGKTSLSGHLAISLARAGFRTLLIDGDLRAPTAQRVFDLPLAPGLCEVLQGEVGGAAAARPTGVPGLSVLTAGVWTLATRQALVGNGWRVAKEQLKAEFDFVVVDTSPLLLVADALLLAREADAVIVSVLMGVSQVALVAEAVNRLQTVRAKVTGVIANGVRSAAYEYTHERRLNSPQLLPVGAPETPAS